LHPEEVSPLGQDEHETLETPFRNVDINITQRQLIGCYDQTGPGRKPRNPVGILRALLIMRLKGIRSLRELTRILDVDKRLRRLCLIHGNQRSYPRSVISRFTGRVGADVLQLIIEEKVILLLRSRSREVDVLLDASFIKARSIRHPDDSQVAYSDPDAHAYAFFLVTCVRVLRCRVRCSRF
jgi:transposase